MEHAEGATILVSDDARGNHCLLLGELLSTELSDSGKASTHQRSVNRQRLNRVHPCVDVSLISLLRLILTSSSLGFKVGARLGNGGSGGDALALNLSLRGGLVALLLNSCRSLLSGDVLSALVDASAQAGLFRLSELSGFDVQPRWDNNACHIIRSSRPRNPSCSSQCSRLGPDH